MQSSKEKIEAQLCAYIDGELDDAERAEIEKHLDANPQHKALISELRAASGLLKDLPRAKVPGDLNEGLTGQLERSVLLNPSDEETGDAALRIRRWPQFTAVAAVLLLATGLAFVVYYALPGSQNNHGNQVALDDKSLRQPASPQTHMLAERELRLHNATTAETRGRGADGTIDRFGDAEGRREAADRALAAKPTDSTAPLAEKLEGLTQRGYKAKGAIEDGAANDALALNSAKAGQFGSTVATAKEVEELQRRIRGLGGESDGDLSLKSGSSLYLVVSTRDAAVAGKQINAFFKDNGIPHMTQDLGAVALQSTLADDRRDALNFRYKDTNETVPGNQPAAGKTIYAEKSDAPAQNPSAALGGPRGEAKDQLGQAVQLRAADAGLPRKPAAETEAPAAPEKRMVESKIAKQSEPDQARTGTETAPKQSDVLAKIETQKPRPDAAAVGQRVLRQQQQEEAGQAALDGAKDPALGKQAVGGAGGGTAGAAGLGDASYWHMRRSGDTPGTALNAAAAAADDNVLSRGTMIVARMNRKQAIALSAALSQQDGQTAQLKQVAPPMQVAQGAQKLDLERPVESPKPESAPRFGITDPASTPASAPALAPSQSAPLRDGRDANLALRDAVTKEPAADEKSVATGIRPQERERSVTLESAGVLIGGGSGGGGRGGAATTRPTEAGRETRGIANGAFNLNVPTAPAAASAIGEPKDRAPGISTGRADPMEDPVDVYIVVKDQAPAAAATPVPAPNSATESESKSAK